MKMPMIVTPRQAIVSAVLFCFHGINLFKNLVSRELLRILENFHFSISISKHFDFTFHFSNKSESILISLCTSRKRVKAIFSLCTSRKRVKAFYFHLSLLELQNPTLAGPCFTNEIEWGNKPADQDFSVFSKIFTWPLRNILIFGDLFALLIG